MVSMDNRAFSPADDDGNSSEISTNEFLADSDESRLPRLPDKKKEFTELKEQMYQDTLAQLRRQLQQLQEGTLPEYLKRLKRIEQQYKERIRTNDVWRDYCNTIVEERYQEELKTNEIEFEQKKKALKEKLIGEWEEKRKKVENDKLHMELTTDPLDSKPMSTRKLRRRHNMDGSTANAQPQEKRRKQSPTLHIQLDESDIMEDLKLINKVSGNRVYNRKSTQQSSFYEQPAAPDSRIEDGKLYFEKRWYTKGQAVYVDSKETGKFGASISTITSSEVWVRRSTDNMKFKLPLLQIQRGKYSIRKRST